MKSPFLNKAILFAFTLALTTLTTLVNASTALTLGEVVQGSINAEGDSEQYTFTLSADTQLFFDVQSGSTLKLKWQIQVDNGTGSGGVVASDDLWRDADVFSLAANSYVLTIEDRNGEAENFQFQLVQVPITSTTTVNVGDVVTSQISVQGEMDEFTFTIDSEQTLFLDTQAGSQLRFNWKITDNTDSAVESNSIWSDSGLFTLGSGSYTFVVDGNGDDTGDYQWQLVVVPNTSTTPITIGDVVTGNIAVQGEVDTFSFVLAGSKKLFFDRQTNNQLSIDWALYDASGAVVFDNNAWSDQSPVDLSAGNYVLEIDGRGDAVADYQFQIVEMVETTSSFTLGEAVTGNIATQGQVNHYTFSTTKDNDVFFDVQQGSTLSVGWVLKDANNNEIFNDSRWNDIDTTKLPAGNYTLTIDGAGDDMPEYRFQLHDVPEPTTTPVDLYFVNPGELTVPGQRQLFTLELKTATDLALLRLYGPGSSEFTWSMRDTAGNQIVGYNRFNGTNGHYAGKEVPAGSYIIEFDGNGDNTGKFNFKVVSVTQPPTKKIVLGEMISGRITQPYQQQEYTFDANAGDPLYLHIHYRTGQLAHYTLFSPTGINLINKTNLNRNVASLPETGEYRLVVASSNPSTDNYAFQLSTQDSVNVPLGAELMVTSASAEFDATSSNPTITVSWTVTNTGEATTNASEWVDNVYLRAENEFLLIDNNVFFPHDELRVAEVSHIGALAPGESYTTSTSFAFDREDVPSQALNIIIEADVANQVFEATVEINAFSVAPISVFYEEREASGKGVITSHIDDGSLLPANQPIALAGTANLGGGKVNLFFVMDSSLSTASTYGSPVGLDANGDGVSNELDDLNGDGDNGDIFDVEMGTVLLLAEQFAQTSDDVLVNLIHFGGDAYRVDLGPERFDQMFQRPQRKAFNGAETDLRIALTEHFDRVLGTAFESPMVKVLESIQLAPPSEQNIVFFLTDGVGSAATPETLAAVGDLGVTFYAFQIGLTEVTANLQAAVDGIEARPNSTATGFAVANPNELPQIALGALELASVEVNNQAVAALDAAGNFFQPITLTEGENQIIITAFDSQGNSIDRSLTLYGAPAGSAGDSTQVAALSLLEFSGTFFNRASNRLLTDARLVNGGASPISGAVEVFMGITPPSVSLSNAARTDDNGQAVVIYQSELGAGLNPGEKSSAKTLAFSNPKRNRIFLTSNTFANENNAPFFASTPVVSVPFGDNYGYDVLVEDVDGDDINYSLAVAPLGMTLESSSGQLSWSPTADQQGTHTVVLNVDDGNGGSAQQTFQVSVTTGLTNLPPVITSLPLEATTTAQGYHYQIAAIDPEGGALSYQLAAGATGLSLNNNGELVANTNTLEEGDYPLLVEVIDVQGAKAQQAWTLVVKGENQPPIIISNPELNADALALYHYFVQVEDDDASLSFELLQSPVGMTINPISGFVRFTPSALQVGSHEVQVQVTDPYQESDTQTYTLNVLADEQGPEISIFMSGTKVPVGTDVQVIVSATDSSGIASLDLTYNGIAQTLDAANSTIINAAQAGVFEVVATAVDGNGLIATAIEHLRVADPADVTPPEVAISSPAYGVLSSYLTDIVGSVTSSDLYEYRLDYALAAEFDDATIAEDGPQWTTFASGSTEVSEALLGQLDATLLRNDSYVVRLLAEDFTGNRGAAAIVVNVQGDAKLGEFRLSYTDLSIPVSGIPIQVTRTYQTTQSDRAGDFGFGWRLQLSDADIRETVPVAYLEETLGLFVNNPYVHGTRVYINAPDGQRVGFTFEPEIGLSQIGTIFTPKFIADPGVFYELEVDATTLSQDSEGNFTLFLIGFDYNPQDFRLIEPNGTTWHYNQFDGLERVTDRQGNELEFRDDGIFHSSGLAVTFERDTQGRITQITDTAGNALTYTYNAKGELIEFTNRLNEVETYDYLATPAHYLQRITDSNGKVTATLEFDESGRMTGLTNGVGEKISQQWSPETFTGTITDAKGNVTLLTYDNKGNVLSEQDPLGGLIEFTYDADNNEATVTDANGNTTAYAYDDLGNKVSETDALGNVSQFGFDSFGNPSSVTNALGVEVASEWDAKGNLTHVTLSNSKQSSFIYDESGRMLSITDFNGNTTTFEYTGSFTTPTKVIWPDGSVRTKSLNNIGAVISETDEAGNTVVITRDAKGRMVEQRDALGNRTQWQYAGDLLLSRTDPLGQITRFEYDGNNRKVAEILPDGTRTQTTYDANDNVTGITDALGNLTQFTYDALNRRISRIDATGAAETYEYDSAGNLIRKVDRRGLATIYAYDAANRLTSEIWLDNAGTEVWQLNKTYDAIGNVLTMDDGYSQVSNSYNANNVLVSHTVSISSGPESTLTFSYDGNDNLIGVSDSATSQEISYTSRNFMGSISMDDGTNLVSAALSYDPRGLRTGLTRSLDNNEVGNTQYVYDARQMPMSINHDISGFDASFDYLFDNKGRLSSQLQDSEIIDYVYDAQDQLLSATRTEQANESYVFDSLGNPVGVDVAVDTANRLTSAHGIDYQYDNAGNLISRVNNITGENAEFSYDHRNRLTRIQMFDNTGALVSDMEYAYDPSDRRIMRKNNGLAEYSNYVKEAVWADMDASGNVSQRYLSGEKTDEKLARIRNGQPAWYVTDKQQSVFHIVDSTGSAINQLEYDSFGKVLSETNPTDNDRFTYTGRELERNSQLYDYRARNYDPLLGRFISEDPMGFEAGDNNLYRYVFNSPVNGTDPSGKIVATEYGMLICATVLPRYQLYKEIGECVNGMYMSIATAVEQANSDTTIVPTFVNCVVDASGFGKLKMPSLPGPGDIACQITKNN